MPPAAERRFAATALVLGGLIAGVFVVLVLRYDHDLREVIRRKMIERDAAVLTSVAQQEIETDSSAASGQNPARWLSALLPAAHRQGLLAMAIFDADGVTLEKVPSSQLFVELPAEDFLALQDGRPLTRYWPEFSLQRLFPGATAAPTPVLEVVLPLRDRTAPAPAGGGTAGFIGFVRYHLDARALARELATLDATVRRQTFVTLAVGLTAIALIVAAAYAVLRRAQRTIAERTERLQHANFELTLAAKTSALGQITSHLLHGLQGSVAGLRAVVAGHEAVSTPDWETAAGYTERMQAMIQETVALLGDNAAAATYELTGHELADIIRRRNGPVAKNKGVLFEVTGGFDHGLDNQPGSLLCLISSNLAQNAIESTDAGRRVTVRLDSDGKTVTLLVTDEGHGIPDSVRPHLFEPGRTGRPGGTGLGLAISQLLARQIGASLTLGDTGPAGTTFRVTLPAGSARR